jgi:hypothetical protein
MIVTTLAIGTAALSAYLVLTGMPAVWHDTASVLRGALASRDSRAKAMAFAALWLLIFGLGMA